MSKVLGAKAPSPPSHLASRKQVAKLQSRYTYTDGPMMFLGQQIVRLMQSNGWDCKILYCYRSPADQQKAFEGGFSKAKPFQSPHQYFLAVDIIHRTKAWRVDPRFWDDLNAAQRVVAEKFGVQLVHGHDWDGDGVPVPRDPDENFWDAAHIELKDWRVWRERFARNTPDQNQLNAMFEEVLPTVWKQWEKSKTKARL